VLLAVRCRDLSRNTSVGSSRDLSRNTSVGSSVLSGIIAQHKCWKQCVVGNYRATQVLEAVRCRELSRNTSVASSALSGIIAQHKCC